MTSAPWGTPKAFGLSTITWIARTRIPLLVAPEHGGTPPPSQVCSLKVTEPIPGNRTVVLGGGLSPTDRKSTRLNSSHTVIYTLSLHDALPISRTWWNTSAIAGLLVEGDRADPGQQDSRVGRRIVAHRSEEHTSELQSHSDLHSFPTRRSSDLQNMVEHLRHRRSAR